MSKKNKNKNKIFDEQENDAAENAASPLATSNNAETADLTPDVSNESMVENVPDDPTQMDMLNDKLRQISQLNAELNIAHQQIAELEAKVEKLQSENDQLVMKLAEASAKNAELIEIPLQVQLPSGEAATVMGKSNNKVISKRVNYIHTDYNNNGYGTWH